MRKTILFLLMLALGGALSLAQSVRVAASYNYPTLPGSAQDSVLNGTKSIRGLGFANDIDGDGESEIAVTNYAGDGRVHIFEAIGNDSIRLVWTSPRFSPGLGGSSPRYVTFGDLDNDSRGEVIYQAAGVGVVIFEWDGVVGSDNYGTQPSQTIGSTFLAGVGGHAEYFEVSDYDGDGSNELSVAYNSSPDANDRYYIVSAIGDWNTNDPGFSSFQVEFEAIRTNLAAYGLSGGSPYAMIGANLDGTGAREIIIHNWNQKNVLPVRSTGVDAYVLSDSSTGNQNYQISSPEDDVALFGGMSYDIDNDGREEVYLPSYTGTAGGPLAGLLHMISYESGESLTMIGSANVTSLDHTSITGTTRVFGYGYGDIDGDGRTNIYGSTSYPNNLFSVEFQGGDKRNPANWTAELHYAGEADIYTEVSYIDSLGVLDTVGSVQAAFAGKIWGRNTDFDDDGLEDIMLPYQALNDSTTVHNLTWNVGTSQYDTVTTVIANPKRWGLRIIERDMGTGVRGKEVTVILPEHYKLGQNYPNPFNPSTTITYSLPIASKISLKIYDVLGKEVKTLIESEVKGSGEGVITWDGTNNQGTQVVSGTYFYTLTFGNFSKTNKMMLLR